VGPIIYDGKYLFNKNKFYFKNLDFITINTLPS
jgi:hypothetical protein